MHPQVVNFWLAIYCGHLASYKMTSPSTKIETKKKTGRERAQQETQEQKTASTKQRVFLSGFSALHEL
jgi:hypothetical protein